MSESQSRRRFLKRSLSLGGLTVVAGCSEGTTENGKDEEAFPPTTGVDVIPAQKALAVSIWFTDPVEPALNDRGWDGSELLTFTPEATEKNVVRVDHETQRGYELRVDAEGVVSTNRFREQNIVSSPELTLSDEIPLADEIDPDSLFTLSVESVTKAEHDVDGPADSYEFPFRSTYPETRPRDVSVSLDGVFGTVWETGTYRTQNFPEQRIEARLPDRSVPQTDYFNNDRLLNVWEFTEAKEALWEQFDTLIREPGNASEDVWEDTTELVRTTMETVAGTEAPTDPQSASQAANETYARAVLGATGVAMAGVNTVVSLLDSRQQLEQAGDQYADSMFKAIEQTEVAGAINNVISVVETGRALQEVEQNVILPGVVLSEPTDASRGEALRQFDKHLDAERAVVYETIETLREDIEDGLSTLLTEYDRALLYNTTSSAGPDVVDATEGQVKLNGADSGEDVEPALSEEPVDLDDNATVLDETRHEAKYMGYDAEIDMDHEEDYYTHGVNELTPVGQLYAGGLGTIDGSAHTGEDHKRNRLQTAKHLLQILEVADLLLSMMRLQQSMLHVAANPFIVQKIVEEEEDEVGDEIEHDGFDGEWGFTTENQAEIISRGDPIEMWVENCSTAQADAAIGTVDEVTVAFDWELDTNGWWERPEFSIETETGDTIWRGSVGKYAGDEEIFDIGANEETAGEYENTWEIETDDPIFIRFAIYPSDHCASSDHKRTTLRIPSVSVSTQ